MHYIGIIPARFASSRFPGKPLADIGGKTMIERVYEQALKCEMLNEIVVATDDERIAEHVRSFGRVVMTSTLHRSGTDRCLEAFNIINKNNDYNDEDGLINIQGDEPFVDPGQLAVLANMLQDPTKRIVSLVKKISSTEAFINPNMVKVVLSSSGKALYFSRAPIPYPRNNKMPKKHCPDHAYKHIGLYGFRISTLKQIAAMNAGVLEEIESLEQLRWIENGIDIYLSETFSESIAIDTPEDLKNVKRKL